MHFDSSQKPSPHRSVGLSAYLVLTVLADAVAPLILRRPMRRGKEDPARLGERLGHAGIARPDGTLIWFHAASVGESLSLLTLIAQISEARPDVHLLITTGTRTSADLLAERLPPRAMHQFVPLDTARAVTRFLNHWRPDLAVWAESELWPRLITVTHARNIPMLLINARMSAASARKWARARGMIGALLARFDYVLTQEEPTARLMQDFGLPSTRVEAVGTLKEGTGELPFDEAALATLRERIARRPCWFAASTHPGEEAIVAAAHKLLLAEHPNLLLILAPRHPSRGPEVEAILDGLGLTQSRRSTGALPETDAQVYLADTMGEMGLWYRLAPVAFIGGSLVPIGGHNPYEPASLGAAILTGPHVDNFATIFSRLRQGGGAVEVQDAETLTTAVARLTNPNAARALATAAKSICFDAGNATARARDLILAHLPQPGTAQPRPGHVLVIAPNLKRRLSGVTATIARLVPLQARDIAIVATGPGLPAHVPHLSLTRVAVLDRQKRVWHARRNVEMLLGLALKHLLRKRLKLLFTSASQRHHSGYTKWLIGRMDAVIATSSKTASYLERAAVVIRHGIDTETFRPAADPAALRARLGLPPTDLLIGCYGRIRAQKGTDVFVDAMIEALPNLPGATALVMGRATGQHAGFLDDLRARVNAAGLAERIRFLPEVTVDRMPKWYQVLDLFVAPQRWEGFGLTPLEAMACGVPVIATDVGAFSELVVGGVTGQIIAPGDVGAMAASVSAILSEPERLAAWQAAARPHVLHHFRIEDEATAIIKIYRDLLA